VPDYKPGFLDNAKELTVSYDTNEDTFKLAANNNEGGGGTKTNFSLSITNLKQTGEYFGTVNLWILYYRITDNVYYSKSAFPGKVEITKLDTVNKIIAGTFYFTGQNPQLQTLEITAGRFDVKYNEIN
jgi:hypothetical protein